MSSKSKGRPGRGRKRLLAKLRELPAAPKGLLNRLSAPSPTLFVKIQRVGVGLVALALVLPTLPFAVPVSVITGVASAGIIAKFVGSLPTLEE
jgi:hypothetical protein